MTEKELLELWADASDEINHDEKGKHPFAHPRLYLDEHPRVKKIAFHASILAPVVAGCVLLDKAPAFATAELSITLLAHSYEIVFTMIRGRAE